MSPEAATLAEAVRAMAQRRLPHGYRVGHEAPSSYRALCHLLEQGEGLVVSPDGLEGSIYGSPEANAAFRAWHDYHHWRGAYPFTPAGEAAACAAQCADLEECYGEHPHLDRWLELLRADVNGQVAYHQKYREFVADQVGFVAAYLDDPERALSRRW